MKAAVADRGDPIEAGAGGNPTATSAGPRSQRPALAILCAASLMIILDGTIVTVALPSIQRSLQFSSTSLTWVVNAHSAPRPG